MKHPRYPVVLASQSPRRRRLLAEVIAEYAVDSPDIDEDALSDDNPWQTAERVASAKAEAVAHKYPGHLIVAGDTVVAVPQGSGYQLLGKPRDPEDACRLLGLLAGRTHVVVTGVALRWPGGSTAFAEASMVTFRNATRAEIEAYVATGEPMDKAGAYGIQDAQHDFCTQIEGSTTNVVGLPVERLTQELVRLGLIED